ncbi:MAG: c-type cytochrome domain-containing protein, partial [Pirellulales bacterium]
MKEIIRWAVFGGLFFVLSVAGRSVSADPVDFSRQIRPILAENCFECHGPDQEARQAELRLDTRAGMFAERDENPVVVPGRPGASELVARITSEDDDERMPLADSGKSLTVEQQKLLVQWIRQGAKYAEHWSFEKPRRPPTPQVQDATWPRNLIDNFVLARLEQQELRPAPEADRATLV